MVAGIFGVLVFRDIKRKGKEMTPARKTWVIIVVVFTIVGILNFFQRC